VTSWLAFPPADEVRGTVAVPSSKSATNRALVLAALAAGPVELVRPLASEDTRALTACLTAMGARIELSASPGGLLVTGPLGVSAARVTGLDAGESGTAARFLAAVATAVPGVFRLSGAPRLRERPMGPLVAALREAGADVREEGEPGRLPLEIRGGSLTGGDAAVDASESSQYVSALLLAAAAVAAAARGGSRRLRVSASGPIASAPYVATTRGALAAFGWRVHGGDTGPWSVDEPIAPVSRYETPGDYSSAIPMLAAAGIRGGEVAVRGLEWPSADADAGALSALERMGIAIEGSAMEVVARADRNGLRPAHVVATDFPDSVPALAALAAFAQGETRFEGIAHLRAKESDRLAALSELVRRAGGGRDARDDATGLTVRGALAEDGERIAGSAGLPTFGDHRIAMAGGLLALALGGALIENPDCVAKSYPSFFRDLDSLAVRRSSGSSR
jgi:3-phosphoshikimate 1-carboxyvinyltransferase